MTEVSAAIIEKDGRILICRRGGGGSCAHQWEFPGGKREAHESAETCAMRECREELGIEINVYILYDEFEWEYPERKIRFHFFTADIAKGVPKATEHEEIRWVTAAELAEIPMCPADERVKARLIK